jgi:hypothetical protein
MFQDTNLWAPETLVICVLWLILNNLSSSWHESGLISGRLPGSGEAA